MAGDTFDSGSPIEFLRTSDSRFKQLPGFAYEPHYVDSLPGYNGLRAHYLDVGPKQARRTFLCLHGEPAWSYLYRKMIPVFTASGARVIAPDLLGFGRSDKPINDSTYSFHFHRNFLLRFIEHVDLRNITLVVHDWGGTLGLTLPVDLDFRARLERLIVMNTVLPAGKPLGPHYDEWRSLVRKMSPDVPVGQLIRNITPLTDEEETAYDAPFPQARFKAGVRTFPELAMVAPDMEGAPEAEAAMKFWRDEWSGRSFMAIGAKEADLEPMHELRRHIRFCPEPLMMPEADHFVPEWGEPVARAALRYFGD